MSNMSRREFLKGTLATGLLAVVGSAALAGCSNEAAPLQENIEAETSERVARAEARVENLGKEILFQGKLPVTGILLDVRSDGKGVTFDPEAFETSLQNVFTVGLDILKPEDAKSFEIANDRIFKKRALADQKLPIVISSKPENCYKDGQFVPANAEPISHNTSCGDLAKSFGYTDTVATVDEAGNLDSKYVAIHVAPAAYNGITKVDRNGEIVYKLTPDQAAHTMLAHESLHALRRLLGGARPDHEEPMVQHIEKAYVNTYILSAEQAPSPVHYQEVLIGPVATP